MLHILVFITLFSATTSMFVTVPEGHIGVHKKWGQIQEPLVRSATFYNPLFSSIDLVKYVQDPDAVENVHCVSREGVALIIRRIEIANRIDPEFVISTTRRYGTSEYDQTLVVKPLAQKMRELCAERTVDQIEIIDFHMLDDLLKKEIQRQNDELNTGVTIDWVRITGVEVPPAIKDKRVELAKEKAEKVLVEEKQKRLKLEKETQQMQQAADNEIALQRAKHENEKLILNMRAKFEEKQIENQILIETARATAEKIELEAKAMREMWAIPGYTEVKKAEALAAGHKMIYWGDKLPSVTVSAVGAPSHQSVETSEFVPF